MKTNNLMERENTIMSAGIYEAPAVEIIEVMVEKGYAQSDGEEESVGYSLGGSANDSKDSYWGLGR